MASEIQTFNFDGFDVRATVDDRGEPVIVAADLARYCGIKRPEDSYGRVDDEYKVTVLNRTPGGWQEMTCFREPGVWQFLMTVRLRTDPDYAEQVGKIKHLRKVVFEKVLPEIRKNGSYSPNSMPATEPVPSVNLKFVASQLEGAVEIAKICGLDGNQAILCGIKGLRSITGFDVAEHFPLSLPSPENEKIKTPTQLGQSLGLTAQKVNARLCELGFQVKPHGEWELTEAGKEFGVYLDVNKQHSNGTPIQQIKWKESVLDRLKADAGLFALAD